MSYNSVADSLHKKYFVTDFLRAKCDFAPKIAVFRFWEKGLGATYDDNLKLIGKRAVDFLLMLIELFC